MNRRHGQEGVDGSSPSEGPSCRRARPTHHPTETSRGPEPLQALATQAGLTPEDEFDASWVLEYPDAETLSRAMVAVAGLAVLAGPQREQELRRRSSTASPLPPAR